MNPLSELSVIIPVGPKETAWRFLLADLNFLPKDSEIILVATEPEPQEFASTLRKLKNANSIEWLAAPKGRARQLNFGARIASKRFFWFLHADSRIEKSGINALAISLKESEGALHYFNLRFQDDGPGFMRINNLGVWIRSHLIGLPFGDQGFCMHRDIFNRLGAFNESAKYGEDHLLVWSAHLKGVPIHCTGASLRTSARRYRETGWLKCTARNLFLTGKQAFPELLRVLKMRGVDV